MLEGTDENPRRRWISKDFQILFAAGMLAAFVSVIVQLKLKHIEEAYVEMELGSLPFLTECVFDLYRPLKLALFIFIYLGILTLFWFTKSTKSIWVLSTWMIFTTPLTVAAAYMPYFSIMEHMERINKDSTPAWIEHGLELIIFTEGALTILLIWCIFRAILELFVTKIWKQSPTPPSRS